MKRILCFGDSNTWGTRPEGGRFPRALRWTGVLAAALDGRAQVIEDGVPGRTTALSDPEIPGRNGLEALPGALASAAPLDGVILMLGTNDLQRRFARSATQVGDGMEALVRCVLGSGAAAGGGSPRVLVVAPPPFDEAVAKGLFRGQGPEAERLAEVYAAVANRLQAAFYDAARVALPSPVDGVHLDARAHAGLGRALAAEIERL